MYRTVETTIWTDPKVKALGAYPKFVFVYLLTNPHSHLCGLYYLPKMLIEHETGVSAEEIEEAFKRFHEVELAHYDEEQAVVWVVNMFEYQRQARGDKNMRSAGKHLMTMHETPLIADFLERYREMDNYIPAELGQTVKKVREKRKLAERAGWDRIGRAGRGRSS